MMWKMPASRMRSLASLDRKSRLPVTIAAAIAPSSPPMIASTRSARAIARLIDRGMEALASGGASRGGGSTLIGPSVEPTAPTPGKRRRARNRNRQAAPRATAAAVAPSGRHSRRRRRRAPCASSRARGAARCSRGMSPASSTREHQPRADRPQIDLLDIALQLDDPDMVEHRRRRRAPCAAPSTESREQAARPSQIPRATGRAREIQARPANSAVNRAGSHSTARDRRLD